MIVVILKSNENPVTAMILKKNVIYIYWVIVAKYSSSKY